MLDPYYNMIQHGYGVLWFHIEIWLAMDAHLDGKISVSYRMPRILLRLLRLRLRFPLSDESRESAAREVRNPEVAVGKTWKNIV